MIAVLKVDGAAAILCAFLTNSHRCLGIHGLFATPRISEVFPRPGLDTGRFVTLHGRPVQYSESSPPLFQIIFSQLNRTMACFPEAAGGVCLQIVRAHCLLNSTLVSSAGFSPNRTAKWN